MNDIRRSPPHPLISSQVRSLICFREYSNRTTSLTPSCTLLAWVRRRSERNIAGIRAADADWKKGAEVVWSGEVEAKMGVKEVVRTVRTEKEIAAEAVEAAEAAETAKAAEALEPSETVEAETRIKKRLFTS